MTTVERGVIEENHNYHKISREGEIDKLPIIVKVHADKEWVSSVGNQALKADV